MDSMKGASVQQEAGSASVAMVALLWELCNVMATRVLQDQPIGW